MIAAAAVDIRGGRCVQLVGGSPSDERISLPDPVAVAMRWFQLGFTTLHVVDLDAALGSGGNLDLVLEVAATSDAVLQVGGGIRDDDRAAALLGAPPLPRAARSTRDRDAQESRSERPLVHRIVVGTRAVDDPDWLAALARRWPGRVMPALDVRNGVVLRKGWTESATLPMASFLERLEGLPLAGILTTDVGREGRLSGVDRPHVADILRATRHPVWISGGVTTEDDLQWLEEAGAAGSVLGMAIYTGALDAERVARRWGGAQ
ncbi:MAG: 1-(5-phosphoribosyl)-5-[(5-phosphoribosylamino)methylideneamino] imidazole-4-carboxamide isomerase [Gemmatimonadetes bacterium]|nr:1-(5-phosphoribosyl)-5-[(5-phosphoribosylamino)methylideneamino] imidazole-4-carboxamide isomerase [Gemmatimonadota bacterium]